MEIPESEDSIHWLYAADALTPVARWQNGQLHYVVSDHMGAPRELLTGRAGGMRHNSAFWC